MTTLVTRRLTMRPPRETDAEALAVALNNLNVSRWTGRIPYPYGRADAAAFLAHVPTKPEDALVLFITRGDELLGCIGIEDGEVGYWLAEPYWGQGYGTEAARAIVDHAFAQEGRDGLIASYHLGNVASRRILLGLGFVETAESVAFSTARAAEVALMNLILTRADWEKAKERRR
jgi:RimJ/RimL family protein N-acetyltransferase